MTTPPSFCNENCGSVGTVSQFYRICIPLVAPGFSDYHNGVIYEYKRQETNRCVWERRRPGTFPWTIERLSRYPEGWSFFEVMPVPGKWTWRLSIDILPLPPYLHGWLHQFDRYAPGVPDPDLNCSTSQMLQTYVPLSTAPDAMIVPITSLIGSSDLKQITTSCFCSDNCPLNTRPHVNYLITIPASPLPGYVLGVWYKFSTTIAMDGCLWVPDVPISGSSIEELKKFSYVDPLFDHSYGVTLDLFSTGSPDVSYSTMKQWDDGGEQNQILDARCNVTWLLDQIAGPRVATVRPIPQWICSQDEAREWDANNPL